MSNSSKSCRLWDLIITVGINSPSPPEVRLYDTVQTLVKGARGKISSPVVVFTVCIGKEISAEDWVVCGSGSLGHSVCFVHGVEVISESAKLSLEQQQDR